MRKLRVFNSITLDGYFTDKDGKIDWAHKQQDPEWNDFVSENAGKGGELLFGRKTYDMMKAYWPTPAAAEQMPVVANAMNKAKKVVFSGSMEEADWENTLIINSAVESAVAEMKKNEGRPLVLMGSGSIVQQLTDARLIDEYQLVVTPVVIGAGRTMFDGIAEPMDLKLTSRRGFANGNVVMTYELSK